MKLNSKILSIMAIFLVLISAGSVCAAEHVAQVDDATPVTDVNATDVNNTTNVTNDTDVAPSKYIIPPDANHDEQHPFNPNATNTTNATNATVKAAVQHTTPVQHATGNPILALLAVSAIIGAYSIKRS
ncbi:hypothetical protein TL18_01035 [Methanobrevibacter sp. YE315]|uniref:hypothetical protein n=1 Tax=Methanobrevibacter sp. YE315 TaxID=1609968 RepID=UPI000764E81F|nr:hypothetical protein [Methanobrevibacter sp. YE315]AMD16746.1 hypothetical protein TL18_01035 [Methanobrevibacter sp. YE315]